MKKRLIIIMIAITMLIPNLSLAETQINKEPEVDFIFFVETLQYIEENYPFDTKESELLEGALKGMLQSLDQIGRASCRERV